MPIEEPASQDNLVSSPPANSAPAPATRVQSVSLHESETPVLAATSPDPNLTQSKESPLTDIGKSPPPFSLPFDFAANELTPLSENLDLLSHPKDASNYESSELSDLGDDQSEAETDKMDFLDEQHSSSNNVLDLDALLKLTELARLKEIDSDDDSDVSPQPESSSNGVADKKRPFADEDLAHASKKQKLPGSALEDRALSPASREDPPENWTASESESVPPTRTSKTSTDAESDSKQHSPVAHEPMPKPEPEEATAKVTVLHESKDNEASPHEDQHEQPATNGHVSDARESTAGPIPELEANVEAELDAELKVEDNETEEPVANGDIAADIGTEENEEAENDDQPQGKADKTSPQNIIDTRTGSTSESEAERGTGSEPERDAKHKPGPKPVSEPDTNSDEAGVDSQTEPHENEDAEEPTPEDKGPKKKKGPTEESQDDGDEVDEEMEEEDEEDYDMNEQRKLAIEELRAIEKSFAELRDKLYHDKLTVLEHELQLCLEGSHPELSKIYYKINGFYQDSVRLANSTLSYRLKCIDTETVASRTSIHQNFLKKLMDSKNDMILNTTSLWYKINKERNQMDQLVPDYGFTAIPQIPNYTVPGTLEDASAVSGLNSMMNGSSHMEIPTEPIQLTKKAIKQNTIVELVQQRNNANHQLGILNGLLHFHGFPLVISPGDQPLKNQELLMKKASDEEIAEDFKAMGIPI